jgi:glutamine amidotransferase
VAPVFIGHVREASCGGIALENTHPFTRGRWTFAHNGTIDDQAFLRAHSAPARLAEIVGQTDSELFFAYLLTALDARPDAPDAALADALRALVTRTGVAANFLLGDGEVLYAHRFGRTLFTLERRPGDAVRTERTSVETLATLETVWTPRRGAVFIASEQLSDEPWAEVPTGTLLAAASTTAANTAPLRGNLPVAMNASRGMTRCSKPLRTRATSPPPSLPAGDRPVPKTLSPHFAPASARRCRAPAGRQGRPCAGSRR